MQLVPLTDTPRQTLTTTLGGQRVTLDVWWQPLSKAWYASIDHGTTRLATARQITPWETLITRAGQGFDGDLIALAVSGANDANLGRNAWTRTHALWYLTGAELAAARL